MRDDEQAITESSDSSSTEDAHDIVKDEAKELFDSEHLIPSHQMPYVLQWLRESFSLIELQVLKVSLEKNAIVLEDFHCSTKNTNSKYFDKGQQRIHLLSQAIEGIQETSRNISASQKYSQIPNDDETNVDQMEWNIAQHKALPLYTKTIWERDCFKKVYCLQQECQPWIGKLNNILTMLQHALQYSTGTDHNELLMLKPFMSNCERQVIICLRQLRSISGRLILPILAQHFTIPQIYLALKCCSSSSKRGKKYRLRKIPRMSPTASGHKNYHLHYQDFQSRRPHRDSNELMRQIAAIKIQTSWRAALARNNMLFAISLEQLLVYITVILEQVSPGERINLATIANIRDRISRNFYYVDLHHCLIDFVEAVRENLCHNAQHRS